MARLFTVVALIVSAFCFASVLAAPNDASRKDQIFFVNGQIYCDPCAFQLQSRLSKPLEGVKVTFECTKGEKNVTFVKESTTDKDGFYNIKVQGYHEEEVCMVKPVNTKGTCTTFMENNIIVPTKMEGVVRVVRVVKPLAFRTKTIDEECYKLANELGLDKIDDN
ncbi:putative pollen allergen Ole e 1 family [Medicago truncatula]|uniref:Pollen Ole e I family allergen n=1 Tax=Medicago truncatula TaxID=3880 RepID=A0A072TF49_MEDTR|nr:olee1-like protein [Medicago truncatula]KEH15997.1 pollen Ole e I family allergen [Medicago truncatula]RHN74970.1 putative pollen allergen Ole e 1 family [Medicago truncatula]